jgi:tetratricopeptide (TPR) repeat protein
VRVGLDTGRVVVGRGASADTDVFGDAPNIAARVQAEAEPGSVLITAATHRLIAGLFVVEEHGARTLKGVRQPIVLYRVVQPSGVRGRTPFVGRALERRLLVERWERARDGEGQVVLVTGEAGIGKSRLVQTLREHLVDEPHTWIECQASVHHQNTPLHAVVDMLRQGPGWSGAPAPEAQLADLEQSLDRAGVPRSEAVPLVAPLLGLAVPERYPMPFLSPEGQRKQLLATLAAWLVGLARVQPVVAVLEDLHWVDPSTLELQAVLVEQAATAPLLLLYTARPEFRAPWPPRAHHAQVTLNRLTRRQVREMVGRVSERAALPDTVVETVVARTDGVPLFVEELTKAVLEATPDGRRSRPDEETVGPAVAAELRGIPATLHDSLMARLDRLGPAKEVAQLGAVIGREFSYALLHDVIQAVRHPPLPDAELHRALERITDAELLYARGIRPEATYVFKHALVQDAAYASLLKSRRRELHRLIAAALTDRYADTATAPPEVVAHHYEAAGEAELALTYYQQAGEQAAARSAHEEAVAHLRKAIALLDTLPESRERGGRAAVLYRALAPSLVAARGYAHPETEAAYERARLLANAAGDRQSHAWALLGLALVSLNSAQFERALGLIDEADAGAETARDDLLTIWANALEAVIHYWQGRFGSSLEHAERALGLYDSSRHHRASVSLLGHDVGTQSQSYSACALWQLGYPDRALARAREAIECAVALDHPLSIAFGRFFAVSVHWLRREAGAQRRTAEELVRFTEAQAIPFWLVAAKIWRGNARADPAEVTEGMTLAAGTGAQTGAPAGFAALAEAYQARGQHSEALGAVGMGLAVSAETGQRCTDADLHRLEGEIILERCKVDTAQNSSSGPAEHTLGSADLMEEAASCFRRAIEIARSQEGKSFELRAATSLARLLRDQGKRAEARVLLAPIYGWFTEGFGTRDLIEAKALLEELA